MAAVAAPPTEPVHTPGTGRPRRNVAAEAATEPPNKRRKYIAGATPTGSRSTAHQRQRREKSGRFGQVATPKPRYSNAAAAAAASQASDGYKPREERSWEDFHPELDVDVDLPLFTADEVDGRIKKDVKVSGAEASLEADGDTEMAEGLMETDTADIGMAALRRKPGRPTRRPESMLSGLGSPPAPRITPLPTHNPKERLNLPKPSFRINNHFLRYEEDQNENKVNYVDRGMAHVGYQESDRFGLPSSTLVRLHERGQAEDEAEVGLCLDSDGLMEASQGPVVGRVEYDMDEQDVAWLQDINEQRMAEGVDAIRPAILEITLTQIEKEYHALEKRIPKPQPRHAQTHRPRSSSQAAVNGDPNPPGDEPDSKCSVCDDGDCENANAIIFCDGCDLAVHQECYGVPFIPEGQWFCRKCKEIGRGTPTCIFCPNVDGAFKQTNTLRWSHLLCALWIPEVTVANMTFMEPITDVDKVPKSRWKLHCYICSQKMGACIQCGNKNCYLAFHVTCARKSKLFLKMKSPHQQGLDTTALKAFCDKHVPPEWKRAHDTDRAIADAKRWYKSAFKDRKWADSQTAAVELGAPPQPDGGVTGESGADDNIAATKRRKNQLVKTSWRLPSGAPVVPAVVYNTVETSMARFTIRKRKEFVEKACKYWTLKREARRGAALLKRLQLQLESFSSMEITRRNFAGMGAAGRPRLQRRIEFAEVLQKDLEHLTQLCRGTREREELRLRETELLRELIDTVYFPIPALLLPILQRARKLDEKTGAFEEGFDMLALRLRERHYTSVSDFSQDLKDIIARRLAIADSLMDPPVDAGVDALHAQLSEVKPGTAEYLALSQDQKELKRLAKRILKAVKDSLEDAARKEAELRGREHEDELRKLDAMGLFAATSIDGEVDASPSKSLTNGNKDRVSISSASAAAGAPASDNDASGNGLGATVEHRDQRTDGSAYHFNNIGTAGTVALLDTTNKTRPESFTVANHESNEPEKPSGAHHDLHPKGKTSLGSPTRRGATPSGDVFANGGVPWYLEPFDPVGTTVHEERYTGRAVLRDMSEELSDVDEDTLIELAAKGAAETSSPGKQTAAESTMQGAGAGSDEVKVKKPKRKGKRQQWTKPRVR